MIRDRISAVVACIMLNMGVACILLVTGAGLVACDQKPVAADGYQFGKAEFVRLTPAPRFVVHPTQASLVAAAPEDAKRSMSTQGRQLMAWSIIRRNECEVHIVDPARQYGPEWIGHEIVHCMYGRWHN